MTISQSVKFLEEAFVALNKEYFENALPTAIITIQSSPKAYGHFTFAKVWEDGQRKTAYHEINLSAEALTRPIAEVICTLLHEMVHFYCAECDIQDTSRGGTYHNSRFKAECEARDLSVKFSEKYGHAHTEPTQALKSFCTRQHWRNKLTISRSGGVGGEDPKPKTKKPSSTRKYICPCCGQSIRATKEVNILCIDCNAQMEKETA